MGTEEFKKELDEASDFYFKGQTKNVNTMITKKINQWIFFQNIRNIEFVLIMAGLLFYLVYSLIIKITDLYFVGVNTIIIVILLTTIFKIFKSLKNRYTSEDYNLNLKDLLKKRLGNLENTKVHTWKNISLLVTLVILLNTSIHVFMERKPLVEVFQSEESLWGMLVGAIIGIIVGLVGRHLTTKYFKGRVKKLNEFLSQIKD